MKSINIAALALLCSLTASAQKATEVLDRTASAIRSGGTIHASFRVTQFHGTIEHEATTGEMWMNREQYKMTTPELTTWFDGKTLCSMMTGSDEAYISSLDEQGPLGTGPYHFLNIYKKGYKTDIKRGTLRGDAVFTVTLSAKRADMQPQTVILDIRQSDYRLMCIRAKQDGDWTRIALKTYRDHVPTADGFFSFNNEEHPGVQLIDMR